MGKNKDLQKMLTSFEEEVGDIKEWEIERNDRLRAQSKDAAKLVTKEAKSKGGKQNVKSGHLSKIASLGGKANAISGHIQSLQPIGTKIASELNKKRIVKLDKNGILIEIYESMKEAAILNNRTQSTISNNVANRTKYCGKYKYMLESEYNLLDKSTINNNLKFDNRSKQTKCPHCSKVIKGITNYKRWHGSNCKNNSK